jgi:superfamily I DNA and RNA helicase
MPEFRLAFALTAELRDGYSRILRLTDEQCGKLEIFEDVPRVLVKGAAGTGKTVVLLESARRLVARGKSVLVLCYNRPLCEHLQLRAQDEAMGVDVMTFHHLCRMVIEHAGHDFCPPKDDCAGRFWKVDAPNQMYELLNQYPKRWDAVLVDEGQDFDTNWWVCVESVLADSSSFFHIYYDPAQSIYTVESGLPFQQPEYTLKTNCRNTKNICHLLSAVIDGYDPRISTSAPVGRIPCFIQTSHERQPLQTIDRLVDNLVNKESIAPSQIVILSPHKQMHSSMCSRIRAGKSRMVDIAHFGEEAVTHCTIPRFKGLESEVVIVIDIKGNDHSCDHRQLYTAFSRAKQLLYVLHDESYQPPTFDCEPESLPCPTS